jgi:heme-degrading monooxygenase HmoA
MYVAIFRMRYREGVQPSDIYDLSLNPEIVNDFCGLEGFISWDIFASMAKDGSFVMLMRFETLEAIRAWRNHPSHTPLILLGPEKLDFYDVQITEVVRDYAWEDGAYIPTPLDSYYRERSLVRSGKIPTCESLFG